MIFIVNCIECGARIETKHKGRLYCNQLCQEKYRWRKRQKPTHEREGRMCRFGNEGLVCDQIGCDSCGWNPEVAARRIEKIREERREKHGKTGA